MLFQKKKQPKPAAKKFEYDSTCQKPILKCSICNGEQVAGFKDMRTGKFHEILFIRSQQDLQEFMDTYGLSDVAREY